MPCITHDPNLEARLDINLALYDAVCTALAAAEHIMKEAIATWLSDAWEADPNISRECHRLPWGFQDNPCPSSSKPIPIDKGIGFIGTGQGLDITHGFQNLYSIETQVHIKSDSKIEKTM